MLMWGAAQLRVWDTVVASTSLRTSNLPPPALPAGMGEGGEGRVVPNSASLPPNPRRLRLSHSSPPRSVCGIRPTRAVFHLSSWGYPEKSVSNTPQKKCGFVQLRRRKKKVSFTRPRKRMRKKKKDKKQRGRGALGACFTPLCLS